MASSYLWFNYNTIALLKLIVRYKAWYLRYYSIETLGYAESIFKASLKFFSA